MIKHDTEDLGAVIAQQRARGLYRPTVAIMLFGREKRGQLALGLVLPRQGESYIPPQREIKETESIWEAAENELSGALGLAPEEVTMGNYLVSAKVRLPPERCKHGSFFGKGIHYVGAFTSRMPRTPANGDHRRMDWFYEMGTLAGTLECMRSDEKRAATFAAWNQMNIWR